MSVPLIFIFLIGKVYINWVSWKIDKQLSA